MGPERELPMVTVEHPGRNSVRGHRPIGTILVGTEMLPVVDDAPIQGLGECISS